MTESQMIDKAVERLKAAKKRLNCLNSSTIFAGLNWTMAISLYDGNPFSRKQVRIEVFHNFRSKTVRILKPAECGYTLGEIQEYLN